MRLVSLCAWIAAIGLTVSAQAEPMIGSGGECVPFARQMSGIKIHGDAWTWWDQAEGRYTRGRRPKVGAVLVFKPLGIMNLGHVAVVSRIVTPRVIMVTHANWSRIGGVRGVAERDVTVIDASPRSDWSQVRVYYYTSEGLGRTVYPVHGFIYGSRAPGAPDDVHSASPSPALSGPQPDYIGALIDATN